jgi:predicted nucleic acid-binding protein
MKLVIADTGALISLGHVGQINLIEKVFGDFYIAQAVWEEIQNYENPEFDDKILMDLKKRIIKIKSKNHLSMIMDYGESESIILYGELQADFLLIDDNKARIVAESLGVNCIGSIGLLIKARQKGFITEIKPIFEKWISKGRYFSKKLLNRILIDIGENSIIDK